MERLTRREQHCADPKEIYGVSVKDHDYISAANRLADHEDTGLTPELVRETAKLAIWIHENGLEKIKEWIKADKDGRVVVLPSNKALTNADRIRAATNQQLAKLLYDSQKEFCRLMYKNLGFEDELNFSGDYSDILAWLNAPIEGNGESIGGDEGCFT
jgi:hypothetical protein